MLFFIILTALIMVALAIIYRRIPWNRRFLPLNLVIVGIFAGAIGNLIDRIWHSYVVDFFYFRMINFPVFNVADIYVTVSMLGLIVLLMFYYQEEDFAILFPSRTTKNHKE
jgi:signal peptidase II